MGRSDAGFRKRVVSVGSIVTIGLGAAGFLYALLTWNESDRGVIVAITLAAVLDGLVIAALRGRIAASPFVDTIFLGWNIAHVIASSVICCFDGGVSSPFVLVLFVSVVFAAVSLARTFVVAVAAVDVVALAVIGAISNDWEAGLILIAGSLVAVGFVGAAVAGEQHTRLVAVQEARTEMLQRLARVIEFRDVDTGVHVERMADYCGLIAARLGWSDEEVERLRAAAPMHDVGKVAVPDEILLKPGPLTPDERAIMEHHTTVGHEMLAGSSSAEIQLAATIALTHHEHFDGRGYPQGLAGDDIPLAGRIVAVADVFDALTSDRVYRPALPVEDALRILHDGHGRQFDPQVLDAFDAALDDILARERARARASGGLRSARSPEPAPSPS
jgi:hypothetical protein